MEGMTTQTSFWNTTGLRGDDLASAKAAASDQNAKVLQIMRKARQPMTPWSVWERGCEGPRDSWWLIGSVRRAMTTLSAGLNPPLVMLDSKVMGPRGRECYQWALAQEDKEA